MIVIVTAGGRNPSILIHVLSSRFEHVTVIREQPESKIAFLRRRARKLGPLTAAGQLATMIVSRFGKRFTERRAQDIIRDYGLRDHAKLGVPVVEVTSINAPDAIDAIRGLAPAVVFLVSCRILSAVTLTAMPCPVINFHAGINPFYRGLMGGYWARVQNDVANFGTTVHLVDPGVDTGDVLYQVRVTPSKSDTLHTYPLLQTAAGAGIAVRAVEDALAGELKPFKPEGVSRQWYHPTIWFWLWTGLTRGIW